MRQLDYVVTVPPLDLMADRGGKTRLSEAGSYGLPIALPALSFLSPELDVRYEVIADRPNARDVRLLPSYAEESAARWGEWRLSRVDPFSSSHGGLKSMGTRSWLGLNAFSTLIESTGMRDQQPETYRIVGPTGLRRQVETGPRGLQTTHYRVASKVSLGSFAAVVRNEEHLTRNGIEVDVHLLLPDENGQRFWIGKRCHEKWQDGKFAPPTGHVLVGESAEEACVRIATKETNVPSPRPEDFKLLFVLLDPGDADSDPRYRMVFRGTTPTLAENLATDYENDFTASDWHAIGRGERLPGPAVPHLPEMLAYVYAGISDGREIERCYLNQADQLVGGERDLGGGIVQ